MSIRVRFAPSPTGQVHIGNIRTAIFNYLFARHHGGEFLLRIEDTDLERSTPEAIEKLYECMTYLGLDYDGEVMYQSKQSAKHIKAAEKLLAGNKAYYGAPDEQGRSAVFFRIPVDFETYPMVRCAGAAEVALHSETPLTISSSGISYSALSSKGKPMPTAGCFAGFKDGKYFDAAGNLLFDTAENFARIMAGEKFTVENATVVKFTRYEVTYTDLIKGEMSKPLDGMKDQIIVRSDSSPVFHLANVIDDINQQVTHIVRGDDHVENTYRHVLLFHALGCQPPFYAHLPMIVNAAGKPYSKRDGDAFVGDFKTKGFVADALFNYLSLLGWNPGDDREKMSKKELAESFTFERVKSSPAQLDMNKLINLNGLYIAEMPEAEFIRTANEFFTAETGLTVAAEKFAPVAKLMHVRTKIFNQVASWKYFFSADFEYDQKNCTKFLKDAVLRPAFEKCAAKLAGLTDFTAENIQAAVEAVELEFSVKHGKLFQPLRLAATGVNGGAELDHTLVLIGKDEVMSRIANALEMFK